jgi:uncharacterized membrane protein (DUF4010 family)
MNDIPTLFAGLETPLRFLTSLGIGLLLGLQRQRTPSARAGLRTFALVAVFGTVSGFIAELAAGAWIVAAGLLLVGLMIIAAYRGGEEGPEADSGTTTVIAVLLCYGLGAMVWYGQSQLAVAIAVVATALLQFKAELHGFSEKLSSQDVASMLQFGVLSFIILPLLPNEGYGPHGALNPYHIWLMVVLVSGISLAGYLSLRLMGGRQSVLLVGVSGGLVSSTATTLVFARQARLQPGLDDVSGAIVAISSLMVLVRLIIIGAVVAPGSLAVTLPLFGAGLGAGLLPLLYRLRLTAVRPEFKMPDLSNPAQLRVAVAFGLLYAAVLLASAWLSDRAGSEENYGLYGLALISGLVDIDAITLSSLGLFTGGRITASAAATAIGLAFVAAVAFKLGIIAVAGKNQMLKRWGWVLAIPAAAVVGGLILLAGR